MKKTKDKNNAHTDSPLSLFLAFLRIGAFTFGGGYAMIPLIQTEAVEKHHWIHESDILDILAIAESTPGVLAVNCATFVGYKVAGFWGSLCATVGVVLPSFFIILLISGFYLAFRSNVWVDYAFRGIKAGVCVLLLKSFLKLAKALDKKAVSYIVLLLAFAASAIFKIKAIYVIIAAALFGVIYKLLLKRGDAEEQK